MTDRTRTILRWAPRVFGILATLFIGMFALDAFSENRGFWRALPDFFMHLIPAFALLATVVAAWRKPKFGALIFLGFAAVYAASSITHPNWILAISGPLALVGTLYLLSWRATNRAAQG